MKRLLRLQDLSLRKLRGKCMYRSSALLSSQSHEGGPMRCLLQPLLALLLLNGVAQGAIISSTSFELESPGDQYADTGDAAVDHDLVNNPGESPVDSTITGASILGFDATYRNTRNGSGLTDGDFVGVTSFTGDVGAFTDGVQGYQFSDTDGLMAVTFDTVAIAGLGPVTVSLDAFVNETGWEASDAIRIFATVDGTETDLLNTVGSDIDNLGIEDAWITYDETFTGSNLFLTVELDSNSGGEALYIDNVVISAVPEPTMSAAMIVGLCGFCVRRRLKRKSKDHS